MADNKKFWADNYKTAPAQLLKMSEVKGLISAFNANIDAVIKISGGELLDLINKSELKISELIKEGPRQIKTREDAVRGIIHCFRSGIAEEWLIDNVEIFRWLESSLGYDKLQMGGQGGIVANVMSVCNVNPVYVHCASLPQIQAGLFLDRSNLLSADENGELIQASKINREKDVPLIHWIIEFDKGDVLEIEGQKYICPKSNRFIATYDPLNFKLHIDDSFARVISEGDEKPEIIILSGYQMLQEKLGGGEAGSDRIDESLEILKSWRAEGQDQIIHLEMASTQDPVMRKYLLDNLAGEVDSLGFNERELIDLLEVMGENDLVGECNGKTNSVNLFRGMLRLFEYTGAPRMQLHMFGLYLTLQKKEYCISPENNRNGMQLAAVIAAAKAGTGAIDSEDVLLWAKDEAVSDTGMDELFALSDYISDNFGPNSLQKTGVWEGVNFDVIAVPTILIEKPVTLVGMGDTISSISLVAAR